MLKFMVRGCSGNTNTDGSMNAGGADILRNVLITLGREQQVHQQRTESTSSSGGVGGVWRAGNKGENANAGVGRRSGDMAVIGDTSILRECAR
jgi:hypothetical protein